MFKTFEAYSNNKKEEVESKLDTFLQKEYEEINLKGKDIEGKIYDFFMSHDIETGNLYSHLKKMSTDIKTIEFLKPNLVIHFKDEEVILKLEAQLSHYVAKNPIFNWKLSDKEFNKLKKFIKVQNTDRADFLGIYSTTSYDWFLKYNFKNISNNEDIIKRRIKLAKNNYTYVIESNGKIYRNFTSSSKNVIVLLAEFGYLETIQEYNKALKFALDNYKENIVYFK